MFSCILLKDGHLALCEVEGVPHEYLISAAYDSRLQVCVVDVASCARGFTVVVVSSDVKEKCVSNGYG
jgi:hypothetical protein